MDTIKPSTIQDGDVCFLLNIEYYGTPYRFSTIPISITDIAENQSIPYRGGLSDPTINLQSKRVGVDLEANTIAISIVFEEINWVKEWTRGRTLNDAKCDLSLVVVSKDKTSFTLQDAVKIFTGRAIDSIFGDPQEPEGRISFSIENSINVREVKLLGDKHVIKEEEASWASLGIIEQSKGKIVPFVFGTLGSSPIEDEENNIIFTNQIPMAPAYRAGGTGTTLTVHYLVAYHDIVEGTARVYDSVGGNMRNNILQATDQNGEIYSYVPYYVSNTEGTNIDDNSFQVNNPEFQLNYFVSWGESNGGIPNVLGDGPLTSSVDLSLYVLEISDLDYDFGAWRGLEPILNRYKFGGYVNDLEVNAFDWLRDNIWNLLPIEVVNSGKGLKPNLDLYMYSQTIEPTHHIQDSGEFEIISPMTPLEQDIYNKVTIQFGYVGSSDTYRSKVVIDPLATEDRGLTFKDPLAQISYSRYGLRELVITAPFVWDLTTAIRIARDKIRYHSLSAYAVEISAAPKYGYIDLGEVISLTSERVGFSNHKAQVMSKSWSDNRWRFIVHIEDNPLVNLR